MNMNKQTCRTKILIALLTHATNEAGFNLRLIDKVTARFDVVDVYHSVYKFKWCDDLK